MYCSNCGNRINDEKFCPNCGAEIKKDKVVDNNSDISDEDLVRAYIGPKYEEFAKGNFSVCTFFFGTLYVWYRKMWIFGLLWIGANYLLGLIFDGIIYSTITLGMAIYLAFVFKKQYLEHARKKVAEIKFNYHGNDRQALLDLCRKKGGTTLLPVFLILIPFILIVLIVAIFFGTFWHKIKDEVENQIDTSDLPKLTITNNLLLKDTYQVGDYILNIKM